MAAWIAKSTTLQQSTDAAERPEKSRIDLANPVNNCGGTGTENSKGLVAIFFLGYAGRSLRPDHALYLSDDPADSFLLYQTIRLPA